MNAAFFAIVGAQFFSSLADSALFILCVSLVATLSFPQWMTPMLKMGFVLSYIVLAPFAGAFADRFPKGRVMLLTNTVKMLGCSLILAKANPLLARLARQVDVPIYGVRVVRLPNRRFRGEISDEIKPVRDATGKIDIQGTTQAITSVIEGWVREHPEQWLWLHRRWR